MRIILLGNAGSGKSTLSKRIIDREPAARLSLDEVAFHHGAERRPLQESIADVKSFIQSHDKWVIEGCYADIIKAILDECEELIFLNPGIDTCIAHCRSRPWEPEKFNSLEEQNDNLNNLIEWVRSYEHRTDEYGLGSHRHLYDSFNGKKRELKNTAEYENV
ncbi:hypothetical protein ACF8C6_02510 [Pseudomonas sp. zbq_18]|uniref:hypothetical protein n=1 Tax=Pseudomonas sp. zbq_18 TaxID=3367251 RepID=UPI00370B160E